MQVENREALYTVTARFFKGLGDPARLRILEFLEDGEKSVGEITEHLRLPQNQVSMHLGCLRWCGYVKTRREGRYVFYSLADSRMLEIMRLAQELLQGSEVYLMTCEVIGKTDENLTNVTGWRNRRPDSNEMMLNQGEDGLEQVTLKAPKIHCDG
jgi:DNA-binding transcriptional ArsR family regulator